LIFSGSVPWIAGHVIPQRAGSFPRATRAWPYQRARSHLGYVSPMEYELKFEEARMAA
jgi:hypothetical protein